MTDEEIARGFDLLATLHLSCEWATELGPDYYREKLMECRRLQDQASTLAVAVARGVSGLKRLRNIRRAEARLAPTDLQVQHANHELAQVVDQLEAIEHLHDVCHVVTMNLRGLSTDIRTLMRAAVDQKFLGAELEPRAAPPEPAPEPSVAAQRPAASGSLPGDVETPFDGPVMADGTPAPQVDLAARQLVEQDLSDLFVR